MLKFISGQLWVWDKNVWLTRNSYGSTTNNDAHCLLSPEIRFLLEPLSVLHWQAPHPLATSIAPLFMHCSAFVDNQLILFSLFMLVNSADTSSLEFRPWALVGCTLSGLLLPLPILFSPVYFYSMVCCPPHINALPCFLLPLRPLHFQS